MTLALTGGIASGKSTVLALFADLGAATLNADDVARKLTEPGGLLTETILRAFGDLYALSTNPPTVDRAALGKAIFRDTVLRKRLEVITHPPIVAEIKRRIDQARVETPGTVMVVEVPLLFEVGLEPLFEHTAVVWCRRETQMSRLKRRLPGLDNDGLNQRLDAQMPLDEKRSLGDFLIDSEQPMDDVQRVTEEIYNLLRSEL